jgi:hypothetical protein
MKLQHFPLQLVLIHTIYYSYCIKSMVLLCHKCIITYLCILQKGSDHMYTLAFSLDDSNYKFVSEREEFGQY